MRATADTGFPPRNACDCHVHVVGPKNRYPLNPRRSYTPMDAPREALAAMLARLCLDRVVIVQPSFYGTDNGCTLAALEALGSRARAVAVVADDIAPSEIDAMHKRGVRGLRLNILTAGGAPVDIVRERMQGAARLCARNGWHVQLFISPDMIEPLAPTMRTLPVPVVIDHFGFIRPADFNSDAANCLVELVASGRVWVKLSGAERLTEDLNDSAIATFARRLAATIPEHVVWGSDWPHTPMHRGQPHESDDAEQPYRDVDDARLLQQVATWFEDERRQELVLVHNPARLYGFADA
jgi:predicted TIM-barrel fold metal-dependent hydrolase